MGCYSIKTQNVIVNIVRIIIIKRVSQNICERERSLAWEKCLQCSWINWNHTYIKGLTHAFRSGLLYVWCRDDMLTGLRMVDNPEYTGVRSG